MTTPTDAAPPRLPDIDDARLDAIEGRVFAGIAGERAVHRRRRRVWTGVGVAAAAVVVAVAVVPAAVGLLGGGSSGTMSLVGPEAVAPQVAPGAGVADSGAKGLADGSSGTSSGTADTGAGTSSTSRDVVTTATASVRVGDVRTGIARIGDEAKKHGGYIQGMSIGQTGTVSPLPAAGDGTQTVEPAVPVSGAWITVRIPAAALDDVVASLAGFGQVEASTVDRQDVTDQAVDLRARVDASQASVTRLTELMGKAGSVADLLAAESALADRQATLESLQQQLKALDDQVAMSTLTVNVLPKAAASAANPAGFGSGLVTGWNSLVATLNGLVVAVGFLLPWLAVAAVAALLVWAIVAARRRRRRGPASIPPAE